jgi:transcription antitermination factor NusG
VPLELKVKQKDAVKYFEVGESVRITSGSHSGESGIIQRIIHDKHAVITLDGGGKGEL